MKLGLPVGEVERVVRGLVLLGVALCVPQAVPVGVMVPSPRLPLGLPVLVPVAQALPLCAPLALALAETEGLGLKEAVLVLGALALTLPDTRALVALPPPPTVLLTERVELAVLQAVAVLVAVGAPEREIEEEALGEVEVEMLGVEVPEALCVALADTLPLRRVEGLGARVAVRVAELQREAVPPRASVAEEEEEAVARSVGVPVPRALRVGLAVDTLLPLPPPPAPSPPPPQGVPVLLGLTLVEALAVEERLLWLLGWEVALGEAVSLALVVALGEALGQKVGAGLGEVLARAVAVALRVLRCSSLGAAVALPVAVAVAAAAVGVGAATEGVALREG